MKPRTIATIDPALPIANGPHRGPSHPFAAHPGLPPPLGPQAWEGRQDGCRPAPSGAEPQAGLPPYWFAEPVIVSPM